MAILRYSTSPALFLILTAGLTAVPRGAMAADGAPPRPLMRFPGWVERLDAGTPLTEVANAAPATVRTAGGTPATGTAEPAGWTDLVSVAGEGGAVKPSATDTGTKPTGEPSVLKRWLAERMGSLPKSTGLAPAAAEEIPAPVDPDSVATAAQVAASPVVAETTVTAPVAATPDEMPTLSIEQASFRGVFPGKTTRDELEANWGAGEAFTHEDGSTGFFWKIEPFELVEVTIDNGTVSSLRIKLAEPVPVSDLAKQLEIADLRTVAVLDEQGVALGEVFPERGVILAVKPGTQTASAIMIEPLDPESFVLRAEGEIETCSAYAVADLEQAVSLDPNHVRAHRLLLAMASEEGKWTRALSLAEKATQLDPSDVWTRLKHASVLLALDRPDEARVVLEQVKALGSDSPLVAAQTERLLGRLSLAGATPNYQDAVAHFAEAIRRASPLLVKRTPGLQSAASEVLLDAHMGTALAIAKGTWQQKSRVIPKWISRGETIVTEFKGTDTERQILELQLCRGALAAAAGSTEGTDPLPWVKRLLELRDRMDESVTDPWRRRQIDWELGQGLSDALAAAQKRGDASDMLDNATLTAAYLERGAEQRELTTTERKKLGELMFRIGIMHSVQRGDHATAVTWFDRTIPLWEENTDIQASGDAGRVGECYVSMAISYWQVERREDAMALSRRGVDLMVAAVDGKTLEERALAVAYGNLSTMYAEQGDSGTSRNYAELASRAEASIDTTLR